MEHSELELNFKIGIVKELYKLNLLTKEQLYEAILILRRGEKTKDV